VVGLRGGPKKGGSKKRTLDHRGGGASEAGQFAKGEGVEKGVDGEEKGKS